MRIAQFASAIMHTTHISSTDGKTLTTAVDVINKVRLTLSFFSILFRYFYSSNFLSISFKVMFIHFIQSSDQSPHLSLYIIIIIIIIKTIQLVRCQQVLGRFGALSNPFLSGLICVKDWLCCRRHNCIS